MVRRKTWNTQLVLGDGTKEGENSRKENGRERGETRRNEKDR